MNGWKTFKNIADGDSFVLKLIWNNRESPMTAPIKTFEAQAVPYASWNLPWRKHYFNNQKNIMVFLVTFCLLFWRSITSFNSVSFSIICISFSFLLPFTWYSPMQINQQIMFLFWNSHLHCFEKQTKLHITFNWALKQLHPYIIFKEVV